MAKVEKCIRHNDMTYCYDPNEKTIIKIVTETVTKRVPVSLSDCPEEVVLGLIELKK